MNPRPLPDGSPTVLFIGNLLPQSGASLGVCEALVERLCGAGSDMRAASEKHQEADRSVVLPQCEGLFAALSARKEVRFSC